MIWNSEVKQFCNLLNLNFSVDWFYFKQDMCSKVLENKTISSVIAMALNVKICQSSTHICFKIFSIGPTFVSLVHLGHI